MNTIITSPDQDTIVICIDGGTTTLTGDGMYEALDLVVRGMTAHATIVDEREGDSDERSASFVFSPSTWLQHQAGELFYRESADY